ncbi:TrmH family RNA methyltransferase [Sporocytophaga myxococcoides]|uniref:TrmH family RNA methyltransferase n=1 Tax=Sporocytophaga myxococcoides TaxID=153721 RepID=UPI00048F2EAD|nr:RNA methyltransferase [Sporocytophaga myxococcoides]
MISRNKQKLIKSLQIKKYRKLHQMFLVEGAINVKELLESDFKIEHLFVTSQFFEENEALIKSSLVTFEYTDEKELTEVGTLESNNAALAVVRMKEEQALKVNKGEFVLILDEVRDPGNLGTLIRIADWYGISKVICSEQCAEHYNPKVISATKGSFIRVKMHYCDLKIYLKDLNLAGVKVFGAFLNGENIHKVSFPETGAILLGNEASGINEDLESFVTDKITIPRFGGAESLNVAVASAVILDNVRRS